MTTTISGVSSCNPDRPVRNSCRHAYHGRSDCARCCSMSGCDGGSWNNHKCRCSNPHALDHDSDGSSSVETHTDSDSPLHRGRPGTPQTLSPAPQVTIDLVTSCKVPLSKSAWGRMARKIIRRLPPASPIPGSKMPLWAARLMGPGSASRLQ